MRRLALLAVPLVVLIVACGDDDTANPSPAGSDQPATTAPPTSAPPRTSGSLVVGDGTVSPDASPPASGGGAIGGAEEAAAIADLAGREGVDPAQITVISNEDVTWRSGAIGCPDPEMMYTQALVPGTRIVLELNGTRYEYHSGGPRSIFLCAHPEPPVGE
jgi:hypothetical protein